MTFRYATLNDLDCVIRYINLIPIREHRKKIATITKEKLEKWHLMYHAFVVLAEDKGEVVGYALFYPVVDLYSVSPLMHIEDIFINAPLRRKGYGREFMRYLSNITKSSKWSGMEWNAPDWDSEAIGFFDKIGAERETGRIYFRQNIVK